MANRVRLFPPWRTAVLLAAALHVLTSATLAVGSAPHGSAMPPELRDGPIDGPRGPSLSDKLSPKAYTIRIEPNYKDPLTDTTDFNGEVTINFQVTESTSTIKLNAGMGIVIEDVTIVRVNGQVSVGVKEYGIGDGTDFLTVETATQLTQYSGLTRNTYAITIKYAGTFQNDTRGFYKSTYNKGSETGVLFTTHFQPGHARKAFPCFDEPNLKSPFQLTIDVPEGYDALSNTPVEDRTRITRNGFSLTRIEFKETVTMSTYLVAFVVYETSSFVPTHRVITNDDVTITSWGRKEDVDNQLLTYSQDISFKILQDLEKYTGIPYKRGNINELNQVAVPDFSAGAMENWGLVIYRQSRLFFNESGDSEAYRKSVAAIIAHELTHQWFGNLVTTAWWDTTWLNEGFARYFQYLILSRLYPNWRMLDQLLLDQQMSIFVSDSIFGELPLTYDVTSAAEISRRFGSITYSKGAAIVRMMSFILGEENFQQGLQKYLTRRSLNTATPQELFTQLNGNLPDDRKPPSTTFQAAMESWTIQAGFPVVCVERNYDTKTATFSQYRFFTDGTIETEDNATIYHIPITWSSRDNPSPRFFWFSDNVTLSNVPEIENWMLVHANGYYRVNYDEGNWITLAVTMAGKNKERVSAADRAKLVDDALAFVRLGLLEYRVLGYMLRYLVTEEDVLPWAAANRGLRQIESSLGNVDEDEVFYSYLRNATAAAYKALSGFSKRGDPPELILRGNVLEWACRSGNEECLEEAVHLLSRHLIGRAPLDPNLDDVIRCYGARAGSSSLWEMLWNVYAKEEDNSIRLTLLKNLACTEDYDTLRTIFNRVIRESFGARQTETLSAFQAALSHPKGVAASLEYVIVHMPQMHTQLPSKDVHNILRALADKLSSETQRNRFVDFLEEQLLNQLLEEELVDELQQKVRANVEEVQEYAEEAFKAFTAAASFEGLPSIEI